MLARLLPASCPQASLAGMTTPRPPNVQPPVTRRPVSRPALLRHLLPTAPVIWGILLLCLLPELLLLGADLGLWGSARWRPLAYQNGAVWAGLLQGWRPNYPAQPVVMFASYGWLHAGPVHLAGNLAVLVWLGPQVLVRSGVWGFVILWTASLLCGALAFALLTHSPAPMVGASGALFGLAGAWLLVEASRMPDRSTGVWRGMALLVVILAVNAAAWALQGGHLAWETHLGGLVAGMVFGAVQPRLAKIRS